MKLKIISVIICLALICNIAGCININIPGGAPAAPPPENARAEKVVKDFISAYNKADVDVMLTYIDPAMAKGIRAAFELVGGFLGDLIGLKIDIKYLLDAMPLFAALAGPSGYAKMTIKSISSDVVDETANVYVELEVNTDGNIEKTSSIFEMEMIDGDWYIINFK